MPGLADHRLALEALDQDAALVVHREVDRADHAVAAALAQPGLGRVEQRVEHLLVVLALEEAEHAPGVAAGSSLKARSIWALIRPTDPPVAPGEEQLRLAVLEERVHAAVQEQLALEMSGGTHGVPVTHAAGTEA